MPRQALWTPRRLKRLIFQGGGGAPRRLSGAFKTMIIIKLDHEVL
jgi:hypothetical protein